MRPHLVKWHEEYAARGLKIVEVYNVASEQLAEYQEFVRTEKLPFLSIPDSAACNTYGIQHYPCAYLLDRAGKVIWEGMPVDEIAGIEPIIRGALARDASAAPKGE